MYNSRKFEERENKVRASYILRLEKRMREAETGEAGLIYIILGFLKEPNFSWNWIIDELEATMKGLRTWKSVAKPYIEFLRTDPYSGEAEWENSDWKGMKWMDHDTRECFLPMLISSKIDIDIWNDYGFSAWEKMLFEIHDEMKRTWDGWVGEYGDMATSTLCDKEDPWHPLYLPFGTDEDEEKDMKEMRWWIDKEIRHLVDSRSFLSNEPDAGALRFLTQMRELLLPEKKVTRADFFSVLSHLRNASHLVTECIWPEEENDFTFEPHVTVCDMMRGLKDNDLRAMVKKGTGFFRADVAAYIKLLIESDFIKDINSPQPQNTRFAGWECEFTKMETHFIRFRNDLSIETETNLIKMSPKGLIDNWHKLLFPEDALIIN